MSAGTVSAGIVTPAQVQRAVMAIRRARGVGGDDGFPHGLGCDTQLYLGVALQIAFPRLRAIAIAQACSVTVPDAHFFAELCDIAAGAGWMKPEILAGAISIFSGSSIETALRLERRARRELRRVGR
jgi:hypothetical protein